MRGVRKVGESTYVKYIGTSLYYFRKGKTFVIKNISYVRVGIVFITIKGSIDCEGDEYKQIRLIKKFVDSNIITKFVENKR